MKTCPNCGELLGDSVKECFKCRYSYTYGRVITNIEQASLREQHEETKKEQLTKNPLFEYKVIVVNDLSDGQVNETAIQEALNEWSAKG